MDHNKNDLLSLILSLFLFCLMTGCLQENHKNLREIDMLTDVAPDSALSAINSLNISGFNKSKKSYYCLILSKALDKNYIDVTSNSIIKTAVEYYDRKHDRIERAWSYYYLGRVESNSRRYSDAIISFMNAAKTAEDLKDNYASGLIYRGIGDCYTSINDFNTASYFYGKSLSAFSKSGKSNYVNYAQYDLAKALYFTNDLDSALSISENLYQKAKEGDDIPLLADCGRLMGEINYCRKEYDKATRNYSALREIGPENIVARDLMFEGLAYYKKGDEKRAREIQTVIDTMPDRDENIQLQLALAKSAGDYSVVSRLLEKNISVQDSFYHDVIFNNISLPVASRYDMALSTAKLEQREFRNRVITWTVVALLVIATIVITLVYRNLLHIKEKEANIAVIQNLKSDIVIKETQLAKEMDSEKRLLADIHQLLSDQFDMIDHLCSLYFQYKGREEKNRIYNEVIGIFKSIGESGALSEKIEKRINLHRKDVIAKLREEMPNLKEWEIQLFIFITLGFSASTISILQNISVENVYVRKSALKRKIQKAATPSMDLFLESYSATIRKLF